MDIGDIMISKSTRLKLITSYIISITIFLILSIYLYNQLITINKYYLFIIIPILFMSISTGLLNLIKLLLTLVTFVFDRNDNEDVTNFISRLIRDLNQFYKYILIAIFISLLTTIMVIDIVLCVTYQRYELLALSIVVWILLYYSIFYIIVSIIKRKINL